MKNRFQPETKFDATIVFWDADSEKWPYPLVWLETTRETVKAVIEEFDEGEDISSVFDRKKGRLVNIHKSAVVRIMEMDNKDDIVLKYRH